MPIRSRTAVERCGCLALLFLASLLPALAQETHTIQLTLEGVHIVIEGRIGAEKAKFVLDTGAGAMVLSDRTAKRLKLETTSESVNVQGTAGSIKGLPIARVPWMEAGDLRLQDQTAVVVPLPAAAAFDGILGAPFFYGRAVTIDYDRNLVEVVPSASFKPPAAATALPIRLLGGIPYVEATVDGHKGWFMMDTGAGGAVVVNTPFVEENRMRAKYPRAIRAVTGVGIGGYTESDIVRHSRLEIGPFKLEKPVGELSRSEEGSSAEKEIAGLLGGDVWKRFRITLDYDRKTLYLERAKAFGEPFAENRAGLGLEPTGESLVVRAVYPASPASEAGLKPGDIVSEIFGHPASKMDVGQLYNLFRSKPGTAVRLKARSGEMPERTVILVLRDIVY